MGIILTPTCAPPNGSPKWYKSRRAAVFPAPLEFSAIPVSEQIQENNCRIMFYTLRKPPRLSRFTWLWVKPTLVNLDAHPLDVFAQGLVPDGVESVYVEPVWEW